MHHEILVRTKLAEYHFWTEAGLVKDLPVAFTLHCLAFALHLYTGACFQFSSTCMVSTLFSSKISLICIHTSILVLSLPISIKMDSNAVPLQSSCVHTGGMALYVEPESISSYWEWLQPLFSETPKRSSQVCSQKHAFSCWTFHYHPVIAKVLWWLIWSCVTFLWLLFHLSNSLNVCVMYWLGHLLPLMIPFLILTWNLHSAGNWIRCV